VKSRIVYIICSLLLCGGLATAQPKRQPVSKAPVLKQKQVAPPSSTKFAMYVRASGTDSGISIRWAVNTPWGWKKANKNGFTIERFTISREGKLLPKAEKLVLTEQPLLPAPEPAWETIANQSDYAAIMAQALYGEAFNTTINGGDTGLVAKTINRTNETQQRYGSFYFAADLDFKAACMGAAGLTDTTAKQHEKYLYRIYCIGADKKALSDTAFVMIGGNERFFMQKITESFALFGNKTVSLSWNHSQAEKSYTAYHVEKSADGGNTFTRLTKTPVSAFTGEASKPESGLMVYFNDTLAANGVPFSYRIIGLTPFGAESVCSDTLTGSGQDVLPYNPNIKGIDFDKAGRVKIDWDFDAAGDSLINGFKLLYGGMEDSNYQVVKSDMLAKDRSLWYDIKQKAGYYAIMATPKQGESRRSFPYMIEPEDSIPPKKPAGLDGFVDSSGLVILTWKANKEKDIFGYRVFKKLVMGHDLTALIDTFYVDTVFFDHVNMKQLNAKVYYAIRAYDKKFNPSEFSEELILTKPDIIPPTQPAIADYKVDDNKVWLKWINSQDADVASHVLLKKRMSGYSAGWDTVKVFVKQKGTTVEQQYDDKGLEGGTSYLYTILAKDSSGNMSLPAVPLTIKTGFPKLSNLFSFNEAAIDRDKRLITLEWKMTAINISEIQLYRSEDKGPLSFYKTLAPGDRTFTDNELKASSQYKYGLRAVLPDGRISDFSLQDVAY
jgi:uncharacterized protein